VYNKPKLDQVSPEEEKGILMKLKEEIREDMIKQNMASIIKSSIFFLCRWTRNFQNAVSTHLTHVMVNPNDVLYQPRGKERIYIIKSGKIHIYAERLGCKRGMNTPLKVIENTIKREVSDNCYGYSTVVSTRATKIYAMSKDFTSCYYIEKPHFLDCAGEKLPDFEYYHEIKSKIDQAKSCESFEVPLLDSSKHHYNPSKNYVIRRNKFKKTKTNTRLRKSRNGRATFKGVLGIICENNHNKISNVDINSSESNH
jgi:hypothetical protein